MEKQEKSSSTSSHGELRSLGSGHTTYSTEYNPELLEWFLNEFPNERYKVQLNCPEFTSLCPKTGQPDFGCINIEYVPCGRLVESKSLKLYLFSFRNHGAFHEAVVNLIGSDLVTLLEPYFLRVTGIFNPRGGISIAPTFEYIATGYSQ